ncbi:MAG: transposase family protein [Dehalococcoidia bacterium]|nr:transposase family protein [Dehalococcoidia bacterium]
MLRLGAALWTTPNTAPLISILSGLQDARIGRTKCPDLIDIASVAICAVVRGADSWVDVDQFGDSKEELYNLLELPNGNTSRDTMAECSLPSMPSDSRNASPRWARKPRSSSIRE